MLAVDSNLLIYSHRPGSPFLATSG